MQPQIPNSTQINPTKAGAMAVQHMADQAISNLDPNLSPNVESYVSPDPSNSKPKKELKEVLEISFTIYPVDGTLSSTQAWNAINDAIEQLNAKSTNMSIRIVDKKM